MESIIEIFYFRYVVKILLANKITIIIRYNVVIFRTRNITYINNINNNKYYFVINISILF